MEDTQRITAILTVLDGGKSPMLRSLHELAAEQGVSVRTIRRRIARGECAGVRLGRLSRMWTDGSRQLQLFGENDGEETQKVNI